MFTEATTIPKTLDINPARYYVSDLMATESRRLETLLKASYGEYAKKMFRDMSLARIYALASTIIRNNATKRDVLCFYFVLDDSAEAITIANELARGVKDWFGPRHDPDHKLEATMAWIQEGNPHPLLAVDYWEERNRRIDGLSVFQSYAFAYSRGGKSAEGCRSAIAQLEERTHTVSDERQADYVYTDWTQFNPYPQVEEEANS